MDIESITILLIFWNTRKSEDGDCFLSHGREGIDMVLLVEGFQSSDKLGRLSEAFRVRFGLTTFEDLLAFTN